MVEKNINENEDKVKVEKSGNLNIEQHAKLSAMKEVASTGEGRNKTAQEHVEANGGTVTDGEKNNNNNNNTATATPATNNNKKRTIRGAHSRRKPQLIIEKDNRPTKKSSGHDTGTMSVVVTQSMTNTFEKGTNMTIGGGSIAAGSTLRKSGEIRNGLMDLDKREPGMIEMLSIQSRLNKKKPPIASTVKGKASVDEKTANVPTAEMIDFVELIERHYERVMAGVHKIKYTKSEYESVISEASRIFASERSLIDVDPPCVVVGDLHGQYNDLINMFILLGRPPHVVYVFTGDYVDRGMMSIECIMLLFCYKIAYPENIFLLRGNHEIARVNKKYGFYEECVTTIPKIGEEIWAQFQRCFNNLPISALIATKILCMHGGLSPSLVELDDLRNHPKPIRNPFRGLVNDMLWADPDLAVFEWKTSTRGSGFAFGVNVIDDVCTRLGIELIIRAHQMCFDGYWAVPGRKLITIFSAPVYCNLYKNAGCVLKIDKKLCVQLVAFVPESSTVETVIKQKNRVWDIDFDNLNN